MYTFRQWLTETPFKNILTPKAVEPEEQGASAPAKKVKARRRKKSTEPSPEARAAQAAYYEKGRKAFGKILQPDWGGIRPELHDKLMSTARNFPKKTETSKSTPQSTPKKKWWQIFKESRKE